MKSINFKYFLDGKEITKTQAQDMFDTTTFTIKDGEVYFTTTVTPVSKFFMPNFDAQLGAREELLKFINKCEYKDFAKGLINKIEQQSKELDKRNFNSTRHKYNPNSDTPKFAINVQDALRRAEEHQAQNGREENKTTERFGDIYWGLRPTTEDEEKVFSDWERKTFDGKAYSNLNEGQLRKVGISSTQHSQYETAEKTKQYFDILNGKGVKETTGKLDYSEINFELFDLMAKRFSDNKVKYGYGNTKKPLDLTQIEQATFRHLRKMIQPIEGDEESYLDHLSAVATNLSIILDQLKLKNSQKEIKNQK